MQLAVQERGGCIECFRVEQRVLDVGVVVFGEQLGQAQTVLEDVETAGQ
ncbi:hypothetical protein [Rhodococcus sp. RDE2]|nr:hypothetical protein [Rhodococcus sp. RDE2]